MNVLSILIKTIAVFDLIVIAVYFGGDIFSTVLGKFRKKPVQKDDFEFYDEDTAVVPLSIDSIRLLYSGDVADFVKEQLLPGAAKTMDALVENERTAVFLLLSALIGFLKEEGFLGETVSEIDFLYDNTAIALAELYSEWRETGKLNYDDEDSNVWSAITNFSASATARKDLLRRLRSIKNQVPDEDGEREIVELWKESNNWESWDKHLDSLIELLQQE